jgi:NitT/TauT family transport system ATP-binding protein
MSVDANVGFGLMTGLRRRSRRAGEPRSSSSAHQVPNLPAPAFRRHAWPIARAAFVTDPAMLLRQAVRGAGRTEPGDHEPSWCASEQTGKTVIYITHSIEEALLLGDRCVLMTAQPGRIKQIIDVPFPHPRNLITLSAAAEFGRLKLAIWRVLEDEVTRARAETAT